MQSISKTKISFAVVALGIAIAAASSSNASAAPVTNGTIPVLNYSFEGTGSGSLDDWTTTASTGGGGSVYPRSSDGIFVTAPDGDYVAEIDAYPYNSPTPDVISLSQSIALTSYVPTVGDTLTLNVYVGQEQGGNLSPLNESLQLTLGSTVIDSDPITAPITSPDLTDYSFSYTLTAANLLANPGSELGINLVATNTQAVFDDVQLSVEGAPVVPEPSTWAMVLSGLAVLAFGLRLRRSRQ